LGRSKKLEIGLDPANNRVFLRFSDEPGEIRGTTSVLVQNASEQEEMAASEVGTTGLVAH